MKKKIDPTVGTIRDGEYHPAARSAMDYIKSIGIPELVLFQEVFASNAISGNRLAEICSETIDRVMTGKKVSDRYLLGLAWTIKDVKEHENIKPDMPTDRPQKS